MILCRYEAGESDVVVAFNHLTSTFEVTLPFSIFIKHHDKFVNEFSTPYPTQVIGYLCELERLGFLVPPDIIETLRHISRRDASHGKGRFTPRVRSRAALKLVA